MSGFLTVFGFTANVITVIAGLIAIAGVLWAIFGRAKVAVWSYGPPGGLAPSLSLTIQSVGSNPVRDLELNYGTVGVNGFSDRGDGIIAKAWLYRGESIRFTGFESDEHHFSGGPRDGEYRFSIRAGQGLYLRILWRSPLFPWRRVSRTYAWPPTRRFAGLEPEVLTGRKEARFLDRTRDQSLNPHAPGFIAPVQTRARAIKVDDRSFDGVAQFATVLVGFGPTWQGKHWEDAKRVLDSLAAKVAPRVKVLIVDVDQCPTLAERFDTDVVPVFVAMRDGQVIKSYTGPHSMPDLEREFGDFLS